MKGRKEYTREELRTEAMALVFFTLVAIGALMGANNVEYQWLKILLYMIMFAANIGILINIYVIKLLLDEKRKLDQ